MQLRDRIRQFGYLSTLKTVFKTLLRPIFKISEFKILIIKNHKCTAVNGFVGLITSEKLNQWNEKNEIDGVEYERFSKFIKSNCIGYYIEIENELAAWGFVQTKGTYKYGSYFYNLPESVHMLKNLYVRPNFRGMSLGKKINEARINAIPEGCIPCGFVIPENKYAIRNLKLYGFQEQLKISHISWFKKYTYTRLQLIQDNKLNEIIIKGFKTL